MGSLNHSYYDLPEKDKYIYLGKLVDSLFYDLRDNKDLESSFDSIRSYVPEWKGFSSEIISTIIFYRILSLDDLSIRNSLKLDFLENLQAIKNFDEINIDFKKFEENYNKNPLKCCSNYNIPNEIYNLVNKDISKITESSLLIFKILYSGFKLNLDENQVKKCIDLVFGLDNQSILHKLKLYSKATYINTNFNELAEFLIISIFKNKEHLLIKDKLGNTIFANVNSELLFNALIENVKKDLLISLFSERNVFGENAVFTQLSKGNFYIATKMLEILYNDKQKFYNLINGKNALDQDILEKFVMSKAFSDSNFKMINKTLLDLLIKTKTDENLYNDRLFNLTLLAGIYQNDHIIYKMKRFYDEDIKMLFYGQVNDFLFKIISEKLYDQDLNKDFFGEIFNKNIFYNIKDNNDVENLKLVLKLLSTFDFKNNLKSNVKNYYNFLENEFIPLITYKSPNNEIRNTFKLLFLDEKYTDFMTELNLNAEKNNNIIFKKALLDISLLKSEIVYRDSGIKNAIRKDKTKEELFFEHAKEYYRLENIIIALLENIKTYQNEQMIKSFLKENTKNMKQIDIAVNNKFGKSTVAKLIELGSFDLAKVAIDNGADITDRNRLAYTALEHLLVFCGDNTSLKMEDNYNFKKLVVKIINKIDDSYFEGIKGKMFIKNSLKKNLPLIALEIYKKNTNNYNDKELFLTLFQDNINILFANNHFKLLLNEILERNDLINYKDPETSETALQKSLKILAKSDTISMSKKDIVMYLIERGADTTFINEESNNIFHELAKIPNVDYLIYFDESSSNYIDFLKNISNQEINGESYIYLKNKDGKDPFLLAMESGNYYYAKLLYDLDIDNFKEKYGDWDLLYTKFTIINNENKNYNLIYDSLLKEEVENELLKHSILNGNYEIKVDEKISEVGKLYFDNWIKGKNLIKYNFVSKLIEGLENTLKLDLYDFKDDKGREYLLNLIQNGYFDTLVEILKDLSTDPNFDINKVIDESGKTLLHHSFISKNTRLTRNLIKLGADFTVEDDFFKQPSDYGILKDKFIVYLQMLIEKSYYKGNLIEGIMDCRKLFSDLFFQEKCNFTKANNIENSSFLSYRQDVSKTTKNRFLGNGLDKVMDSKIWTNNKRNSQKYKLHALPKSN